MLCREAFWQWLVRVCAGVGGIIATSHIFAILIKWVVQVRNIAIFYYIF